MYMCIHIKIHTVIRVPSHTCSEYIYTTYCTILYVYNILHYTIPYHSHIHYTKYILYTLCITLYCTTLYYTIQGKRKVQSEDAQQYATESEILFLG